eukprot:COSAG02_NODE_1867_length_10594_cov_221.941591_1_plen_103_part_00
MMRQGFSCTVLGSVGRRTLAARPMLVLPPSRSCLRHRGFSAWTNAKGARPLLVGLPSLWLLAASEPQAVDSSIVLSVQETLNQSPMILDCIVDEEATAHVVP